MIQRMAREFSLSQVLPAANELDPQKGLIPLTLRKQMADLGFFGILIPEEFGGLGLGVFEYALVTEELSRGWMSAASLIARGNGLGGGFSEEQRRRYLPRQARGEFLGAFALSEPDAGSDVANIACRAEKTASGWRIHGTKTWCTFADQADYIVLFARTSPPQPGRRHTGLTTFFFEKDAGGFPPGITGVPINKIGYFGWQTWQIHFDGFDLPEDSVLGSVGRGFYNAMVGLETGRVHTAARAIGLARGALEDSVAYSQNRMQFGKAIADFQATRFKLAEMAAEIEAARQLMYYVADEVDSGRRCDKEASMAKWFASEMAERVTSQGLQIHGGYGYTSDLPLERYWRDARLTKIFEGTSEIQLKVISDRLLDPNP